MGLVGRLERRQGGLVALRQEQRHRLAQAVLRLLRGGLDQAGELLRRGREAPLPPQEEGEAVARLGRGGVETERPTVRLDRRPGVALFDQLPGEDLGRGPLGRGGVHLGRPTRRRERLVEAPELGQKPRPRQPRVHPAGRRCDERVELRQSLLRAPQMRQRHRQLEMGLMILRIRADGMPELLGRGVDPPLPDQQHAEVVARVGVVGVVGERGAICRRGVGGPPGRLERHAEVVVDPGAVGIGRDGPLEPRHGGAGVAASQRLDTAAGEEMRSLHQAGELLHQGVGERHHDAVARRQVPAGTLGLPQAAPGEAELVVHDASVGLPGQPPLE